MSHSSALNKCLDDWKELSEPQRAQLWEVVKGAASMQGVGVSESVKVEAIRDSWNQKNFDIVEVNGVGLLGLMSKAHAQKLLRKRGGGALAAQLGIRELPIAPAAAPWEPQYAASMSSFPLGLAAAPHFPLPHGLLPPFQQQAPPTLPFSLAAARRDTAPRSEQLPKKRKAVCMPREVKYADIDGLPHRQLGAALKKACLRLGQSLDRGARVQGLKKHYDDQNDTTYVLKFT